MNIRKSICLPSILLLLLSSGCAAYFPVGKQPAEPTRLLTTSRDLLALPKPKGKIPVAVYSFRDQTGQYKDHPTSSTFSTAVTQGATAILVEALLRSGWFVPLERENLNDLLTERKIIRAKLENDKDRDLQVLKHAPLLLEGGIVAYETNMVTGGIGAKYFGAGGGAQIRRDQVTIYLRSVDVLKGEIVHSISTTKSILSEEVDFGIFRFVKINRLLEAEAGFSSNEPPQICVREAIEMAVINLIIEGVMDGHWALADQNDINAPIFQQYLKAKDSIPQRYDHTLVSSAQNSTQAPTAIAADSDKKKSYPISAAGRQEAEQSADKTMADRQDGEKTTAADPVLGPPKNEPESKPLVINGETAPGLEE
ncbi:MAG: hypothetical protein A2521_11880 [Deltaproteobacteria bacterium RIFOXYD12_FULL_57_12]|nr:MAG: hypothetical protein A2521_11880 [Deltaproteobacteria bacterium RIFOXYD12_FULL_57_12]